MKKLIIKYNLIESFYYLYIVDLIFLILIPLFTTYFIEDLELLKLAVSIVGIIVLLIPIFGLPLLYVFKKDTVEFTENEVKIQTKVKPQAFELSKIESISYVPNKWYKLPFIEYYDGGQLSFKHKNGSYINIRIFKSTYKKLTKELGYQIELKQNKINWGKSFRD
ncbi:hypothetical protein JV173_04660 [Acholeplasma equirhinis]|uniref:hypothetical protein n=1 Tax=Acholeplasma equirhinis TaxID=555393 RepID=UPI00197ACC12|nr:hypothetical protein [Acholeplasma equirhinis]MBN3490802.1 hypothetical protein [Acholeplasma equirhinis]